MPLTALPIDDKIEEIRSSLETSNTLLVQASAGSGKTTRIPPSLLNETWALDREIWVLVPRRLAAKMSALRVAEERGEAIGETIGYQFRFEKVGGPKTRLRFLTEGMLMRLLLQDPSLNRVACVILDEFHERHLHTDVALANLRKLQRSNRKDLKLVLMSATLPTEDLFRYLGDASIVRLEITLHPVTTHFLSNPMAQRLEDGIRDAVSRSLVRSRGDLLIFLPGMAEIRRTEERLLQTFRQELQILPLHGDLPRAQQQKIFEKFSKPKVILTTNIAESSITIEGITTVIDSGLHRQASYSWWSGIPRLTTKGISQASAIQRAGRAGRTGAGFCERLFTKSDFEGRPRFETPEIGRADLSQTVLEVKSLSSWLDFDWIENPHPESLEAAVRLLYRLGALDRPDLEATVTELGQRMISYPLHPRLARMVLEADRLGVLREATTLAALISEDDLQDIDLLHALETQPLSSEAERLQKSLLGSYPLKGSADRESLRLAILAGFPDRVAQKKISHKNQQVELRLTEGGTVTASQQAIDPEVDYCVILEAQEKRRQGQTETTSQATALISIAPEVLLQDHSHFLKESTELVWNSKLKKIEQRESLCYGRLILSERRKEPEDSGSAVKVLMREALGLDLDRGLSARDFLRALEAITDPLPVENLLARVEIFSSPLLDEKKLAQWIGDSFIHHTDLSNVDGDQVASWMRALLPPGIVQEIDIDLPKTVMLSKGRHVTVHYRLGEMPWIESRLQDFFGMMNGPSVMRGTVPLRLHLLAPNHRPIQVTQDLTSFWKNIYPEVRRQLSRRYPKHSWPEDPTRHR